jgi:radical SAM protein with 4Fe4S-binding SPASM domain
MRISLFFDAIGFFSKCTPFKLYNALKVYLSFYLSKWMKKPIGVSLPFTLTFEPTTQCNLSCPECPSGLKSFTRPTGYADLEIYNDFIEKTHKHLIYLYLYFQGEPFLHKNFLKMVQIANEKKIYTVTSTNGHFLTASKSEEIVQSGLDRIIISVDGSTQETYEQYRIGGNLEKVLAGAKNLVEAKKNSKKKTPFIIFQMLVVAPNENQVDEVKKLAKEVGVDHFVLKTAQIYDFENGSPLIPENSKYSRYKKNQSGKYEIKNPMHNQCWKLWHSAVCTFDGNIVPCCFDKDAKYAMGNIKQKQFREIWLSPAYFKFRSKILQSRSKIDICQNCSEGTKVWESI